MRLPALFHANSTKTKIEKCSYLCSEVLGSRFVIIIMVMQPDPTLKPRTASQTLREWRELGTTGSTDGEYGEDSYHAREGSCTPQQEDNRATEATKKKAETKMVHPGKLVTHQADLDGLDSRDLRHVEEFCELWSCCGRGPKDKGGCQVRPSAVAGKRFDSETTGGKGYVFTVKDTVSFADR